MSPSQANFSELNRWFWLSAYIALFCSGDSTGTESNFGFYSSSSPLGEKGTGKSTQKPLHYKSCLFHRVVKDFMIQGGDFSEGMMWIFEEDFNAYVIEYYKGSV